ncbi:MAG TPA: type I secretion C-terminal target domain-containing protein, partial [Trichocoleus sp.]
SNGALNFKGMAVVLNQVISVTDLAAGQLTFTSSKGFSGAAIFNYTVSDGLLSGNVATVTINVASSYNIVTGVNPNGAISGLSDPNAFSVYNGNNIVNGGSDLDRIYGGVGNDILNGGSGNDLILGGDGNDVINGGSGNDFLDGAAGNDTLMGSNGADWLVGGTGNDVLYGGRDNDILVGGSGADMLNGGMGADIFKYQSLGDGGDTITDFEIVSDRIDLSALFGGLGSFTGSVQLQQMGANTLLLAKTSTGTQSLALLQNVNASTLGARHFIFR